MKEIKYTTVSENFCDSILYCYGSGTRINNGSGSAEVRNKTTVPVLLRQKNCGSYGSGTLVYLY
jgi:hypothetical protein